MTSSAKCFETGLRVGVAESGEGKDTRGADMPGAKLSRICLCLSWPLLPRSLCMNRGGPQHRHLPPLMITGPGGEGGHGQWPELQLGPGAH